MADNSSNGARRRLRRRAIDRAQVLIGETCGDLAASKRIVRCGRVPTGRGRPRVAKFNGQAYTSGLQTCGSVWSCVACSYKIRRKRAAEINTAVEKHLANGGGVLHVVVTMPHRVGEALDELWGVLSDCWAHVTSGGSWKAFRDRHDVLGYVRAAEVTHGTGSGWHPHSHVLLFIGQPMSPVENDDAFYELRRTIRTRWCRRMAAKYGRTVSEEFGISVDPVKPDEAPGSGEYLTKAGYEIAMADNKIGRSEGSRTPFAIAHDAAETGDTADIELVREWVESSHNKRSITWSKGLRDAFGLGAERTDQELAAEDAGGETVAEIDTDLWRLLARRRDGARARLLCAFEIDDGRQGVAAAVQYLVDIGYPVGVDEAGPVPVIRLVATLTTPNEETSSC